MTKVVQLTTEEWIMIQRNLVRLEEYDRQLEAIYLQSFGGPLNKRTIYYKQTAVDLSLNVPTWAPPTE